MMAAEVKIALVTGGATGIGAAIVRCFAEQSMKVAVCDIDRKHGEELAAERNTAVRFYELDIANEAQVVGTVDKIVEDLGRIDVLVNNAGITADKLLIRMDSGDWNRVLDVNLTGTFLMTRAVARYMMKQRYGRIVNISSVIGILGNFGQANYAASKAGIIAFTKSCAKELASRNINVNAIAPGFIKTRMTDAIPEEIRQNYLKLIPLNRFGEPKDVADLVAFLVSDEAGYITGQTICVDGGMVMQ
ncbi:MAG: 3-oxoacyl-[acyl-carrier-protein] reductase [candidate division WOR-3 bacterium]|nr:MAG: 3-oxoacyl-[acyl-carrier-protein] reductase [candidate division WOR-3 bacterium]